VHHVGSFVWLIVAVYFGCVFSRRSQNVVLFVYLNGWTGWQCSVKCMFFSSEREHLVP